MFPVIMAAISIVLFIILAFTLSYLKSSNSFIFSTVLAFYIVVVFIFTSLAFADRDSEIKSEIRALEKEVELLRKINKIINKK